MVEDTGTAIDAPFSGSLTDRVSPVFKSHGDEATNPKVPAVSSSSVPTQPPGNFGTLGSNVPMIAPAKPRTRTGGPVEDELGAGTRVGDYEIEGKIGEGAMGAVYRAVHPTIGRHVAVKIMKPQLSADPGAIERFTREARAVAAIRHPGIVDVFGFGTLDDGRAFLIMEWVDGVSLGARVQHGRLAPVDAFDILDQIARALGAAHDKGIIHRDLKPDNVFLQHVAGEKPIVKILDFGLAKLAHDEPSAAMTQTGQLLGTPVYLSPEQCRGKGVDHRTDIYALGCIAYELICGRVPFDADNVAELIAAHLGEKPPIPRSLWPEIPPQLDSLLFAMLAKDPLQRPTLQQVRQTIAATRASALPAPVPGNVAQSVPRPHQAVSQSQQSETAVTSARPVTTPGAGQPDAHERRSRHRVLTGVAVALAVLGGAIMLVIATSADDRLTPQNNGSSSAASAAAMLTDSGSNQVGVQEAAPTPVTSNVPDAGEPPAADPASNEVITDAPGEADIVATQPARTVTEQPLGERLPVPKPAPTRKAPPVRAKREVMGVLSLSSKPRCDIYIDGKATGLRTPQREIKLEPGRYTVTLISDELAIRESFHVEIKADKIERVLKDYSDRIVEDETDANKTTINPFKNKRPSP